MKKKLLSLALVCILTLSIISGISAKPIKADFITTPAIAGGGNHSLALKSDGTVWAWGDNGNGQLGDETTAQRNVPVQVKNLTNAISIAACERGCHSLALKSDGTVWAWGDNSKGQLGDGTTRPVYTGCFPSQVLGPDGEGYLNLLGENPINLIIHSPQSNTSYSEVTGHNTITVMGTITDVDNDDIVITATLKNTSNTVVATETTTVTQCGIGKQFTLEFTVDASITEGQYYVEVTASDGE